MVRPIYFMVPFWGKRYRERFVDLCLPSLFAPRNLPLVRQEDGHRFLIATTKEDWDAIQGLPIMARLARHARPVWIEIDGTESSSDAGASALARYGATIRRQNDAQRKLVDAAYEGKAYGSLMFPDVIYSDGMVACLLESVAAGDHLVVSMALRQTEETVVADLGRRGLLPADARLSETAASLALAPRLAAQLAIEHLHPEITPFEEGNPRRPFFHPFTYWRMSAGRGFILHTFFAAPVLMDFAVLRADHAQCLDQSAFENVYISSNFDMTHKTRIIRDTDEFTMLSLTPAAVNWSVFREPKRGWGANFRRICSFHGSVRFFTGNKRNWLRQELFRCSIRWHGGELDEAWREEEQRIEGTIDELWRSNSFIVRAVVAGFLRYEIVRTRVSIHRLIFEQIGLAIRGDAMACARLRRGVRVFFHQIVNPNNEPSIARARR